MKKPKQAMASYMDLLNVRNELRERMDDRFLRINTFIGVIFMLGGLSIIGAGAYLGRKGILLYFGQLGESAFLVSSISLLFYGLMKATMLNNPPLGERLT